MPDLVEQMYCSQQIFIPPNLPSILKKYAKAAIRTQPGDLLSWSSAYFRALSDGIPPPAKERIEYPPVDTPSGLSPGFLKVLINQIGKRETVHKDVLAERWKGVCLNANALQDLLDVGMFEDDVSWLEFLAICVGTLEPSLTRTMVELCELLTDEPEGGRAAIPVTIFLNLYKYLAKLDCGPVNRFEDYEKALKADSETQCQATDLKPTEEEKEPQEANIDWDTAIGDESPDEGIVVEAADIENDQNGQDEETGEQEEAADTATKSPELAEAESEENREVNEEEVTKIEVVDDAQSGDAFEDVGLKETEVSKESEEGVGEDVNMDKQMEENETEKDESADIKVDENDTTEDEKKEEPDNEKAEDGVDEADYMENGESNGGAKEETDEDAVAKGNESPLEKDDAAKIKEESPTDPGNPIDEAADATSPGNEDDDEKDDAEAVTADVSQLEEAIEEPAGVDEGQGEEGENESEGQTTDETEKDATHTPANEGEGANSDEANVDVENEDESDEPPDAIDDTKDIKVGSTTSDEIPVESTDSPGEDVDKDEAEEKPSADEGIEAPTTPETDETASGANKEFTEGVQDEETAPAGDGEQENLIEAPNDADTDDKSGAEIDLANATLEDEASQVQAEGDAARDREDEKDVDPSTNQVETEELAADKTKDQEGSTGAVDDQQDAANQTAEEGSEETSVDGKEPENTESAADAIPEESATGKTLATENVDQAAEDENGNENKPLQENSVPILEEAIDPKSAYIVNDDGTLSAPRAESVLDEDALKERDSDISVYTKKSDDGMMVWPDIKPQEKEEADAEPLLEKEVTSEDGIEVFTDIEMQPHQEELKLLPEQQEEEVEAEQEENIFAPQIDSFTDLIEAESAPVEEASPEQLAAALDSMIIGTEMAVEEPGVAVTSGMMAPEPGESDEGASQGPAELVNPPTTEVKAEQQDQKKEKKPRRQKKDVEIETLVKKDSDMMLLPTPITSDIMLYMDGACEKTAVKLNQTQQLYHKMSMIDVQVAVPADATIVEVVEYQRYPKWMHIPGIGPTVPDHIIEEAERYFLKISELQEGMVMPRNIKHFHCPPLELIADCPEEI